MAWSPSGKARVCKTLIRGFDSRPGLQNYNYLKNAGRIRCLSSSLILNLLRVISKSICGAVAKAVTAPV